jgi:D-alanine transaminase
MARQISVDAGAAETLMFRHGFLSEAAASNIWVVKDGAVQGPPKNHLVLEGIRYGYLEELCARHGVPFRLRPISRDEVLAADELLITSASKEILPITTLDGQPVGNGRPGAVYRALRQAYDDDIAALMLANIPEQGEAG